MTELKIVICDDNDNSVVAALNLLALQPDGGLKCYPTLRDALSPVLALAKRTLDNPAKVSPVHLHHCERLVVEMKDLNNRYTNCDEKEAS